jgi:TM2 domain-containing membrane protein YozV
VHEVAHDCLSISYPYLSGQSGARRVCSVKKATKAALLSGLVFPGLGNLYLKRWLSGILLAGIAGYTLYYIMSIVMRIALDISAKIESGAVASDIDSVTLLVSQQLEASEQATNIASLTLLACWLIGIVSAYLSGRVRDLKEAKEHYIDAVH